MALSRPLLSRLLPSRLAFTRPSSSSSSSSLLVNDSKYQFLQDLGLKENNSGVFDGEWKGSGEVSGVLCEAVIIIILSGGHLLLSSQRSPHRLGGDGQPG